MRPVSAKRRRELTIRRRLLEQMRSEGPVMCQFPDCGRRADDANEILPRGRGGSITDRANIMSICRAHHDWLHTHPKLAHEMGLMKHGWES